MKNKVFENKRHSIENSFSSNVERTIPTETVSVPKRFYNNKTKENVKYDRKIKPTDSSIRKTSIKRLNELKDENNSQYDVKEPLYEIEVLKHHRRKYPQTELIEVDTYKDSTNHKKVRISVSFFNHSMYEYQPSKSISLPIKDFKKMMKDLNDIL